MLEVHPVPVETVETLDGELLTATTTLPSTARRVAKYEIQLTHRPIGGEPSWESPLWIVTGAPVVDPPIADDDDDDDVPSPTAPAPPQFVSLGGCQVSKRMRVDDTTPAVVISTDEPIDAYRWRLLQDDVVVEKKGSKENGVTSGITDGVSARFRPTFVLRQGPPVQQTRLEPGEFLPPFETGIVYDSRTYSGHGAETGGFAVDWNRHDMQDDHEWVFACAPGKVWYVEKGSTEDSISSKVLIEHKGRFQTVYVHMDHIQVVYGEQVKLGQRLGQVSNINAPNGPHLHLQMRRRGKGAGHLDQPAIKQRIEGVPQDASRRKVPFKPNGDVIVIEPPDGLITGKAFPGDQSDPEIWASARRASDGAWSRWAKLPFRVRKVPTGVPCPPGERPGLPIERMYDGPDLEAGGYVLRYQITDNQGNVSEWAFDTSVEVSGAAAN